MVKTKKFILSLLCVVMLLTAVLFGFTGCETKDDTGLSIEQQAINFLNEYKTNISKLNNLEMKIVSNETAHAGVSDATESTTYFKKTEDSMSMYYVDEEAEYWFQSEECANTTAMVKYTHDFEESTYIASAQYKYENTAEFTNFFLGNHVIGLVEIADIIIAQGEDILVSIETDEETENKYIVLSLQEQNMVNGVVWTFSKLSFGDESFYALTNCDVVGAATGMTVEIRTSVAYDFEDSEMPNVISASWDRYIIKSINEVLSYPDYLQTITIEQGAKEMQVGLNITYEDNESYMHAVSCHKNQPYSCWKVTGFDTSTLGNKVLEITYLGLNKILVPYTVVESNG